MKRKLLFSKALDSLLTLQERAIGHNCSVFLLTHMSLGRLSSFTRQGHDISGLIVHEF